MRRAAKIDRNQKAIVEWLRTVPGVTVATGHDDIIVGFRGQNYWLEIKAPDAISTKTGKARPSSLKPSQKKLLEEWLGQYSVVSTLDEILIIIGVRK